MKELQSTQKSYRLHPRNPNKCYICGKDASTKVILQEDSYKDFEAHDIEFVWEGLGAKLCYFHMKDIIPLGLPDELDPCDLWILEEVGASITQFIKKEVEEYKYFTSHREACDDWEFEFPFDKIGVL